jgi:hypothetical protein
VIARQTDKGGIVLAMSSDPNAGKLPPSADFAEGGWTHPVGLAAAGAGLIVAGIGGYEISHGRSQISSADSAAAARGGAYTTSEVSTISSAKSAQKTGVALVGAAGALIAAGAVLYFAF